MSVKQNVLANYLGQAWITLMGVIFLPLYIQFLGMEAYGLVGLFATVQAVFVLLDFGMTPTLSREMSRYTASAKEDDSISSVLRTMEYVSFATAGVCAVIVWSGADWIAESWLRLDSLPVEQAGNAVALMGVVAGLRLAEGLYRGAMIGLQRQVALNVSSSILATLRWAGGVGVMAWWSPTIVAFFVWQAWVSLLTIIVLACVVYKQLPRSSLAAKFSLSVLSQRVRFSSGMMTNAVLALLLTQLDKILLSRILSLEAFGYYILAATVANLILQLVVPISQAYYPHFARLFVKEDISGLTLSYHQSSQLVCAAIFPLGLLLAFFGESILVLWTGNDAIGRNISPILALLAIANTLYGAMFMPNMLRLAYGWAWYAVKLNTVAVLLLVPAILWVTPRYGAVGAAWVWLILNAGYIAIGIPYLHRRVLPNEMGKWFKESLVFPLIAVVIVMYAGFAFMPKPGHRLATLMFLFIVWASSVIVVVFTGSSLRRRTLDSIKTKMKRQARY